MTQSDEPGRWRWSQHNKTIMLTVDARKVSLVGPYSWQCTAEEALASRFEALPWDVEEKAVKHLAAVTPAGALGGRSEARLRFWRHFDGLALEPMETDLPEHMAARISAQGIEHGTRGPSGWQRVSTQLWDRFLLDGPTAWHLPLALRRSLRSQLFAALRPGAEIGVTEASPLLNYAAIDTGYWEREDGIRGDLVGLEKGRVTIGGWDNPRDGGAGYRSLEDFLRAPTLPSTLRDLEAEICARILRTRVPDDGV